MLSLQNIHKEYPIGDTIVRALRGVSVTFRKNEFVAILGPSGCGKTTLLNIIGGLDHYTEGDLSIDGRSTKHYKDSDWDAYRNHSIGFVFQSYNLIPHQTVLANVELSLTLSGIGKAERRRRAIQALEKVGLGDQLKKKPNQMSGGQMQRVAIARALVNDPEILLADEPTGALDSETSVAVMEILKEVAKDRLVIMVTHNPALADDYATRIIKLLDGQVTSDSDPYTVAAAEEKKAAKKQKKPSMSIFTALSLSLNNLMTKKGRTFLTSFAGSIGIIGIALILSLSNGVTNYINSVQEDTLSSYPITIESETMDMNSLMVTMMGATSGEVEHDRDKVYANMLMYDLFNKFVSVETSKNDLTSFKAYVEEHREEIDEYASAIVYDYGVAMNIYSSDANAPRRLLPSDLMSSMTAATAGQNQMMTSFSSFNAWQQILPGRDGELVNELLYDQYDVIAGRWPQSYNEIVLTVDENNEISDLVLYMLGLRDQEQFDAVMEAVMKQEPVESPNESYTYDEILAMTFRLVPESAYYKLNSNTGLYENMQGNETYLSYILSQAVELKIVGILRPSDDALAASITGNIGYTQALSEHIAALNNESPVVKAQLENPDKDMISGLPFRPEDYVEPTDAEKFTAFRDYILALEPSEGRALFEEILSVPSEESIGSAAAQMMEAYPDRASMEAFLTQTYSQQMAMDAESITQYLTTMTDEEVAGAMMQIFTEAAKQELAASTFAGLKLLDDGTVAEYMRGYLGGLDDAAGADLYDKYLPARYSVSNYTDVLKALGYTDLATPTRIHLYAASFSEKDEIAAMISAYNSSVDEDSRISYTDYVALMLSSVTTIINAISYILIAFVAISLVVSSIMIGIITYISVLERTKEIGILRSVGASKKDVSRVFNAETLIVGFTAGLIGIVATVLLNIPITIIVQNLADINARATLPPIGAVILVAISMLLTFVAGLFPSRIAANKDPVVALRTE